MRRLLSPLLAVVALATAAAAQSAGAPARAMVTYLSGTTAYLDAGRDHGLVEGLVVTVIRNGVALVDLTVTDLASRRAACAVPAASVGVVVVGDTVEFIPAARRAPEPEADAPGVGSRRPPGSSLRFRGRLGLRYLALRPTRGAGGFTQPALDLRLDLSRADRGGPGASVDIRARQTYVTRADGSTTRDARTSVYQAALSLRIPDRPWRLALGRQYLAPVSSISLFDGLLVEAQGRRLGAGLFAGSEPDQATMGYSAEVRDYGGFVE